MISIKVGFWRSAVAASAMTLCSVEIGDASEPLAAARGLETPRGPLCGRYAEDGCERSGWPLCIGRFAKCSVTADHTLGYVGGGSAFFGDARTSSEGTFALDYSGHWFSRNVWLFWNHGRKHQGGSGAYASDGPKLLPE